MLGAMTRDKDLDPNASVRKGDVGIATTPLRPAGTAEFGDALIDVVCETGFAAVGSAVRVVSVTRYRVVVETVQDEANS
jgi:membrane-bound serine protease (ClpP class)